MKRLAVLINTVEYSKLLARELGQSDRFVYTISYSAQMHDVGKIHKKMDEVFTSFLDGDGKLGVEGKAGLKR